MKNKFFMIVSAAFLIVAFVSCNMGRSESNYSGNNSSDKKIETLTDSVKEHLITIDENTKELVEIVDTLSAELSKAKMEIDSLRSSINSLKSPSRIALYMALFALVLAIISIVLLFWRVNNLVKWTYLTSYLKNELRNYITLSEFQQRIRGLGNEDSGNRRNLANAGLNRDDLEKRIVSLERKVGLLTYKENEKSAMGHSESSSNQRNTDENLSNPIVDVIRVGYANINNKDLFLDIFESKQESCVYKISYLSKDTGMFEIISLDKIKSRNGVNDIVEYQGDCTMEEATQYTLLEKGQCKRINENTWQVTQKLKIKISK